MRLLEEPVRWFSGDWLPYKFSIQDVGFASSREAGVAVGPGRAIRKPLKRYILSVGASSLENWHEPCTSGNWDLYRGKPFPRASISICAARFQRS